MNKCWCGNENLEEYSEKYFKCSKCHTLISRHTFDTSVYNVENEDEDLYGKNYWEVAMTQTSGKETLSEVIDLYLTERVLYWLKHILRYVPLGADVAEVGCGLGQLQYVLNRIGYRQVAYELSPYICQYMSRELGITVKVGEFSATSESYDAILAFDLFEHLTDPEGFLQNCADSLKERGVLCFQTPCYTPELSYQEMLESEHKFSEQLKDDQHVYLYSRDSMRQILRKFGFEEVVFVPAFFGDDYDMFFFASKMKIAQNSEDEIDEFLNQAQSGRLVKAMLSLFDQKNKVQELYNEADRDRNLREDQICELTELLRKEHISATEQVEELTGLLKESETDRAARLKQVDELSQRLQESETDRAARLKQVEELSQSLQESEADRAARLKQVEELSQSLQESEADRAARLKQVEELSQSLQESEADRAARLEQIETLTKMLQESEADRAARLEQIETLTQMIHEIEAR